MERHLLTAMSNLNGEATEAVKGKKK